VGEANASKANNAEQSTPSQAEGKDNPLSIILILSHITESNGMTRNVEKKAPAGKSVTGEKVSSGKELVGPGMGGTSSFPPLIGKKRKSESAPLSITDESTGTAAKKSKMMASPTNHDQPVQKPSVQRPRPRPLAKKADVAGGETSVMVSGVEKGNKKRSNPAEDERGNTTDPATPVPPAKKVKGSTQRAQPLRRTGKLFYLLLTELWSLIT
jgi:hypothetical protein